MPRTGLEKCGPRNWNRILCWRYVQSWHMQSVTIRVAAEANLVQPLSDIINAVPRRPRDVQLFDYGHLGSSDPAGSRKSTARARAARRTSPAMTVPRRGCLIRTT